jgi:hypothetical protein
MAKIQVYVSEDLKARMEARGIESPSAICQDALEAAVSDEGTVMAKTKQIRRLLREIDQMAGES